jgi:hypothetical protein
MRFIACLTVTCLVLLTSLQAGSTTVLKVPLEDMTRRSDLVIRATVEAVQVPFDPRDARPISTDVTLRIVSVLKGHASAPVLRINLPGGVGKDTYLAIPGVPTFHVGEEVLLFLERTSRGWIPSGLSEGTFRLRADTSGVLRAQRSTANVARLVRDSTGRLIHLEGPDPEDSMALPALLDAVRRGLLRQGGAR